MNALSGIYGWRIFFDYIQIVQQVNMNKVNDIKMEKLISNFYS